MKSVGNKITAGSIVLLVFSFIALSGTMTSGFHFVDDHEIIKIDRELQTNSLISVAGKWLISDIDGNTRFRPVYIVHRVLETSFFGTDFTIWSVYHGILFVIALISFFLTARNLKFSICKSLIFIVIVFIGPQSAVLWRLGPGEGLAMAFLGLAFLFMSLSVVNSESGIYKILFIVFLILAAFTKESFLLAVPAIVFLKISIFSRNNNTNLYSAAKRNISLLIPLLIAAAGLLYIFIAVGTGYASEGQSIESLVLSVINSILVLGKAFLYPLIFSVILFAIGVAVSWRESINYIPEPALFMLLLVLPNIFLYSSTGLEERYLLPSTIGLAYLMLIVLDNFKSGSPTMRKLLTAASFLVFVPHFVSAAESAAEFTKDGKETGILLNAISDNEIKGNPVLLAADPVDSYELSVSLQTYLAIECDIKLLGYALIKEHEKDENKVYEEGWNSYFRGSLYTRDVPPPGLLVFLDKTILKRFESYSAFDVEGRYTLAAETSHFALYRMKQN